MKKCIVVILAVSLSSADSLSVNKPLKHSIQLEIKNVINISSILGSFICYKRHFNTTTAVRVGLGFNAHQETAENVFENSNLPSGLYSSDNEQSSASLFANYLNYPVRRNNFWLYYGIGPSLDAAYRYTSKHYFESSSTQWEKMKSYSGGLIALGGIEWIFSKQFSLFTEYTIFAKYTYSRTNYGGNNTIPRKSIGKNLSLNYGNAFLGISMYF